MSHQTPDTLRRIGQPEPNTHGKDRVSDKKCSSNPVQGNSKSGGNSRAARVGIRSGGGKRHTLAAKLAARTIHQPSGCWEVQGHALHSGHVQLSVGSPWHPPYVRVRAHVFAWEQATGRKVPAGQVVMHACDNPRCVNPAHLSIGTQHDNILDSVRKGRYNCFGRQKLNAEQVRQIRALSAAGHLQKDIAKQFGIARNTVSGIVNRKTWDHLDRVRHFAQPTKLNRVNRGNVLPDEVCL